jgi:hypothetical protein
LLGRPNGRPFCRLLPLPPPLSRSNVLATFTSCTARGERRGAYNRAGASWQRKRGLEGPLQKRP